MTLIICAMIAIAILVVAQYPSENPSQPEAIAIPVCTSENIYPASSNLRR